MRTKDNYHQLNYQDNLKHYRDFAAGGKSEAMARTWLETGTVDAWRHHRMYRALDPLLETEQGTWLTIGDGRYGKDSKYISDRGGDATATDLDDSLLKEARDLGFITKFSRENAESLSFQDASFDYILCKESYHHFPRPALALYEMLRVASNGVVLIEPNDQYIGYSFIRNIFFKVFNRLLSLVNKEIPKHAFEPFGNYIYSISQRELEKVAMGMNYSQLAFKGLNDFYEHGVEFEEATEKSKSFRRIKARIFILDLLARLRIIDHVILVAIIFKRPQSTVLLERLKQDGYAVVELPVNPNPHGREPAEMAPDL
jgi:ubiquinone/menaquinone biosynthesis C-methylase UbiE